jgi:hypothetical protein
LNQEKQGLKIKREKKSVVMQKHNSKRGKLREKNYKHGKQKQFWRG